MHDLGTVLSRARKEKGKSLKEVAERIKKEDGLTISPQYLNDIEHNRRIPSDYILSQLARYYGVAVEYLHVMAGALPTADLRKGVTENQVKEAYQLFRKALDRKS